jgi:uncharacterized membrane protein YdbT with pleckstrin-like domain
MAEEATQKEEKKDSLPIVINPSYVAVFVHKYWITLVIFIVSLILPVLSYTNMLKLEPMILLTLVGLALSMLVIVLMHAKLYQIVTTYEIHKASVIKRYGIIRKRTVNAPMEMITDMSIERDIVDHLMRTATLLVNTAGTNEYAVHIKYVSRNDALWMQDRIMELRKRARRYHGPEAPRPNVPPQ